MKKFVNIVGSNSVTETEVEQYAAAYLKQGISHGITYQVKLLTWVAWRLLYMSHAAGINNWCLGTEVCQARGFHDLILRYDADINDTSSESDDTVFTGTGCTKRMYRFVQIKHRLVLNKHAKISDGCLKSKQKKNQYSLIYLFKSYLNLIGKYEKIMTDQIVDMTVFTNVDIAAIEYLVPIEGDTIFGFAGKGKCYRVNIALLMMTKPGIFEALRNLTTNTLVIMSFLSKLVFAVDQPSESHLEDLIVLDMGRAFSVPQIFYNDLYKNIYEWFLANDNGKAPYLTERCTLQYLLKAQDTLSEAKRATMHAVKASSLSDILSSLHI